MGSTKGSRQILRDRDTETVAEREKLVRSSINEARKMDDAQLGALAVKIAGRRKVWHIVKKAIKEKAFRE